MNLEKVLVFMTLRIESFLGSDNKNKKGTALHLSSIATKFQVVNLTWNKIHGKGY